MTGHAHKAAQFLKNVERAAWHDETLWIVRQKRDKMVFISTEKYTSSSVQKYTILIK